MFNSSSCGLSASYLSMIFTAYSRCLAAPATHRPAQHLSSTAVIASASPGLPPPLLQSPENRCAPRSLSAPAGRLARPKRCFRTVNQTQRARRSAAGPPRLVREACSALSARPPSKARPLATQGPKASAMLKKEAAAANKVCSGSCWLLQELSVGNSANVLATVQVAAAGLVVRSIGRARSSRPPDTPPRAAFVAGFRRPQSHSLPRQTEARSRDPLG